MAFLFSSILGYICSLSSLWVHVRPYDHGHPTNDIVELLHAHGGTQYCTSTAPKPSLLWLFLRIPIAMSYTSWLGKPPAHQITPLFPVQFQKQLRERKQVPGWWR